MLLDEPTQGMGHEDVERVTAADQEGLGQPHGADGRAQHERGRQHRRPDHRAAARRGARRRALRRGLEANPQVLQAYMGSEDTELQGAHG
jgi:branched-chain amino acid transport system ATP-binding protein